MPLTAISVDKYEAQQTAIDTLQKIKEAETVLVKTVERKEVNQEPPLLYDLTTLQKEANIKLNFSADKTLSIAQKLYEGKLISYPRTGSCYISQDVFEEISERLANLEQYTRFAGYAAGMKGNFRYPFGERWQGNRPSRPDSNGKLARHTGSGRTGNL